MFIYFVFINRIICFESWETLFIYMRSVTKTIDVQSRIQLYGSCFYNSRSFIVVVILFKQLQYVNTLLLYKCNSNLVLRLFNSFLLLVFLLFLNCHQN